MRKKNTWAISSPARATCCNSSTTFWTWRRSRPARWSSARAGRSRAAGRGGARQHADAGRGKRYRARLRGRLLDATATLDRAKLKQVLYNYLSNAIKFTPEGGRVGGARVSAIGSKRSESRSRTPASGSRPRSFRICSPTSSNSMRAAQRSIGAPGWDCRSPSASSRRRAARSGSKARPGLAAPFGRSCRK